MWLASWRDSNYNVRHDLLYKAETNNQAEYGSMLFVLHHVYDLAQAQLMGDHWLQEVMIIGDSQLVVRQMQGEYKVKEENLRPFWLEAINLVHVLEKSLKVTVTFDWVRREVNNKALKIEKKLNGAGRHHAVGTNTAPSIPWTEDPEPVGFPGSLALAGDPPEDP